MIKVVVDLDGADKSAEELISGIVDAINENSDLKVIATTNKDVTNILNGLSFNKDQLEVVSCTDEVTNLDSPARVFRSKPESSLIKGINIAKENDGFVSCGNTGAVLVSSIMLLGRIKECRPALSSLLPTSSGKNVCIVDCGANVDCKIEHLLGFAYMGKAYQEAMGLENPRISLLSNGSEEKKGNELIKSTHQLFKEEKEKNPSFNFIGNVEGNGILLDQTDVIVCDGYDGNVVIKTIEGAAKTVFKDLMVMAKKSDDELSQKVLNQAVKALLNKYDYNGKGGAVLLGVNKPVVKGHGAANSETIYSCIKICYNLAKNKLIENLNNSLN